MSNLITIQPTEIIENNQWLEDDRCEFKNDVEIIADFLYAKAKTTAKSYYSILKQLSEFSNGLQINQWNKKLILAFLEKCKATQKVATVNKKVSCIRSFLSHCVREGYLDKNVAINITKVKEDKDNVGKQSLASTERIIGSDKVWELINAPSNQRDHLLLKVAYLLGLRAHEVIKLHWDDITPSGNGYKVKVIGKNNKLDFLPIHADLINELKSINQDGYIFKSRKGDNHPISKVQLHRVLKTAALEAGLDVKISTHWLRHQRCSDLVNSGKYTLSQVQKFMRHSSPTITATYIHVKDEIGSDALL